MSLEEADGSPIPSQMGKMFLLLGLGGPPLPWHRLWDVIPKSFLIVLLQQSNWQSFGSNRDSFQEEIHWSAHYHFSIIYLFSQSRWIFCRDRAQAAPIALGSLHIQTLPGSSSQKLCSWSSFASDFFLVSFLSLMAVWVLETSYTTLLCFPSSSIAELISRPWRRRTDRRAEPPLPIHLWLGCDRCGWFETARSLLPNWICHKLIIAKCSWQREV